MKRMLLDVNVVLDILLDRKPHAAGATAVWAAMEKGLGEGYLAAHGLTTIHYLIGRDRGRGTARQAMDVILSVLRVSPVDGGVIRTALGLACPDFEDAVAAAAAHASGCDAIVTRDARGFRGSPVAVITPEVALPWLAAK